MVPTPWVAEALAASPVMTQLNALLLDGAEIGTAGVLAMTCSPHQPRLTQLGLCYNRIDDDGAEALAAWSGVRGVKYLGLAGNDFGARGVEALVASPCLQPQHFHLFGVPIGDEGTLALSRWPGLMRVRSLDLSYCGIGTAGVTAILESPYLARIRYLVLSGNEAAWQKQGELRKQFGERVMP